MKVYVVISAYHDEGNDIEYICKDMKTAELKAIDYIESNPDEGFVRNKYGEEEDENENYIMHWTGRFEDIYIEEFNMI